MKRQNRSKWDYTGETISERYCTGCPRRYTRLNRSTFSEYSQNPLKASHNSLRIFGPHSEKVESLKNLWAEHPKIISIILG
jgi:hypothetical protein